MYTITGGNWNAAAPRAGWNHKEFGTTKTTTKKSKTVKNRQKPWDSWYDGSWIFIVSSLYWLTHFLNFDDIVLLISVMYAITGRNWNCVPAAGRAGCRPVEADLLAAWVSQVWDFGTAWWASLTGCFLSKIFEMVCKMVFVLGQRRVEKYIKGVRHEMGHKKF